MPQFLNLTNNTLYLNNITVSTGQIKAFCQYFLNSTDKS
jgi:hypothetical protein